MKIVQVLTIGVMIGLCVLSLVLMLIGTYILSQVDFEKMIGKNFKDLVPARGKFLDLALNDPEISQKTLQLDTSLKRKLKELQEIVNQAASILLAYGAIMITIRLFGIIIIFQDKFHLILYCTGLALIFASLIACSWIAVNISDRHDIQDKLFKPLEDAAFIDAPPSRYMMAVFQQSLKCCGVRSAADYFCHGTYDYWCNPGCVTFIEIWNFMLQNQKGPPICLRSDSLRIRCNAIYHQPFNCLEYMNIPYPINAKSDSNCDVKVYKKHFSTEGNTTLDFSQFAKYDATVIFSKWLDPSAFGSLYSDPHHTLKLYKHRVTIGCGYKIWTYFPFETIILLAFIILLLIILLIGFEICLIIVAIIFEKMGEQKKVKTTPTIGFIRSSRRSDDSSYRTIDGSDQRLLKNVSGTEGSHQSHLSQATQQSQLTKQSRLEPSASKPMGSNRVDPSAANQQTGQLKPNNASQKPRFSQRRK